MRGGRGRLFGHVQHEIVFVNRQHAALEQLLFGRLKVAHNAGCLLFEAVIYEFCKAEIEHVVACNHEQIFIYIATLYGQLHVAYRPQAGFVRLGAIVQHSHRVRLCLCPVFKMLNKLMVRYDYIFVHCAGRVYVVQQPVEYRLFPYLKKRLGKILGKRVKPRGVARR